MATPAVKAAVAVGTAATVGYAAYQHWSEGKEREAAEEAEAAMKEERRQRWVEAMERAQQQQPGDGKGSSGGGPDLSLFAHHEEGFVFEKLAELQVRPGPARDTEGRKARGGNV